MNYKSVKRVRVGSRLYHLHSFTSFRHAVIYFEERTIVPIRWHSHHKSARANQAPADIDKLPLPFGTDN